MYIKHKKIYIKNHVYIKSSYMNGEAKRINLGMNVKEGWLSQIGQRNNQKIMIGWTGVYTRGRSI